MKGLPGKLGHHRRKLCWCVLDKEAYQIRCYDMSMKVVSCIDLRLAKEPELSEPAKKGHYPVVFSSDYTRKAFTLEAETEERQRQLHAQAQAVVREMDPPDKEMIRMFLEADDDGSFTLEFNEVKRLLMRRGVQISVSTMRDKFDDVDYDHNGSLDFGEFEQLEHNIQYDKEIEKIFRHYAGHANRYMSRRRFVRFLRVAQGYNNNNNNNNVGGGNNSNVLDETRIDALMAKYKAAVKVPPRRATPSTSAVTVTSTGANGVGAGAGAGAASAGTKKGKRARAGTAAAAAAAAAARAREAAEAAEAEERRRRQQQRQEAEDREIMEGDALDMKGFTAFIHSAEDNPLLRSSSSSPPQLLLSTTTTTTTSSSSLSKSSAPDKKNKGKGKKGGSASGDEDQHVTDNNSGEGGEGEGCGSSGSGSSRWWISAESGDLERPLAQYLISGCANPCADSAGKGADPMRTLEAAIAANCRYYELSALGKGDSVVFGIKGAKAIDARAALEALKGLLARDATTPLILALEVVGCSPAEQEKLLALLDAVFGKAIVPARKVFTTIDTPYPPAVLRGSASTSSASSSSSKGQKKKKEKEKEKQQRQRLLSSAAPAITTQLLSPRALAGKVILVLRKAMVAAGSAKGNDANGGNGKGGEYSGGDDAKGRERYLVRPDDPGDDGSEDDSPIVPGLGSRAGLLWTTFQGVTGGKHPTFPNAAPGVEDAASHVVTLRTNRTAFFCTPANAGLLRGYCASMLARSYSSKEAFALQRLCCSGAQIAPASYAARKSGIEPATLIAREFFRGRGMVPKPPWLNTPHTPPPAADAVTLKVTVINARQLPKVGRESTIDPYVTAAILGFDKESSPCANPYVPKSDAFLTKANNTTGVPIAELAARVNKDQQTPTVKNNGWDPAWNTTFEFTLYAPALDALVLTVKDKDFGSDDFVGFAALPCDLINPGYHSVKLLDPFGNELPFTHILCYFATSPLLPKKATQFPMTSSNGNGTGTSGCSSRSTSPLPNVLHSMNSNTSSPVSTKSSH